MALFNSTDRFIDTLRTPHTKEAAEAKVDLIKADQQSKAHKATNVAMKV